MTREWAVVIRGDWYLPHLINMLDEYRGNSEQRSCADEVIAQIRAQMIPLDGRGVIKTTRPLVVIDPEDREQVERLAREYVITWLGPREEVSPETVEQMQAALRSLIAPPKPPEPTGMGAVVEDDEGVRYVGLGDHYGGGQLRWKGGRGMTFTSYDRIHAVRILSEGVDQ